MDRIFYVEGCRGKYSDRYEWPVRAFATEAEADAFCLLCAAEATRVKAEDDALRPGMAGRENWSQEVYNKREAIVSKYDERCRGNIWDDVAYGVVECPFGPVPS